MSRRPDVDPSQAGAALLSVLLLVAILSVIAATTLDRVILSTKLAQNGQSARQARLLSYAAEDLVLARIADLRSANATQTTLDVSGLGKPRTFTLPDGRIIATPLDGGNCFNLNSLVVFDPNKGWASNPLGHEQFLSLMVALSIAENEARPIADAATDWADSDSNLLPSGAEDAAYQSLAQPYVAANQLYVDKSELRAVAGVSPQLYARLEPFICALPIADLSALNVNTLQPDQWPLLAMLYPAGAMTRNFARNHLANRPIGGYGSLVKFWKGLAGQDRRPLPAAQSQTKLFTNWFLLDLQIESGDVRLREKALIAAEKRGPPRILWRSWGEPG